MTLEIIEKVDVLNQTYFDTRTGDTVDIGEDNTLGNLYGWNLRIALRSNAIIFY